MRQREKTIRKNVVNKEKKEGVYNYMRERGEREKRKIKETQSEI